MRFVQRHLSYIFVCVCVYVCVCLFVLFFFIGGGGAFHNGSNKTCTKHQRVLDIGYIMLKTVSFIT